MWQIKCKFGVVLFSFLFLAITLGIAAPAAYCQKIELSLANEAPPFFVYTLVSKEFKKLVEDKIGTKVTVKLYPSGQLGTEKDTLEGQMIGTVDMAIVQSSLLALWEPQMVYVDVPYLYRSIDHAMKVINGPIGKSLNKKMEKHGIMVLAGMNLGFRCIYNSKRPIYKPEDIAGM